MYTSNILNIKSATDSMTTIIYIKQHLSNIYIYIYIYIYISIRVFLTLTLTSHKTAGGGREPCSTPENVKWHWGWVEKKACIFLTKEVPARCVLFCILAVLHLCLLRYFPSTNPVDHADKCYTSLYFSFLLFFYVSSI